MSGYPSSTDPYRAVITDLRDELAAIDQRAASLRSMIDVLEAKAASRSQALDGAGCVNVVPTPPRQSAATQLVGPYDGLGLGDACVEAIKRLGGQATNQQIVLHLQNANYRIKSDNPLNNVGTGLNHRSKRPNSDITREGNFWVLKKCESPAVSEASHMNGAAVQPA